jgi:spore maturation protein CgeB
MCSILVCGRYTPDLKSRHIFVAFPQQYVSTILGKSTEIGYNLPSHRTYLLNSFNATRLLPAETVMHSTVRLNSDHTETIRKQFTTLEKQGYEKRVQHCSLSET